MHPADFARLTPAERAKLITAAVRRAGQAFDDFGAAAERAGPALSALVEAYGAACRAPGRSC